MLYLAPPSGDDVIAAMEAGLIGCMTTPLQGNKLPDGVPIGVDNGRFGKGWVGFKAWFAWVKETIATYGRDRILWVTVPDVPFDAGKTLDESLPWLSRVADLGVKPAFVAQNGAERGLIPWGQFQVLFLGGGPECVPCAFVRPPKAFKVEHCPHCHRRLTEWKTSPAARALTREAIDCGLDVHMGRVNGAPRLVLADEWGCVSADGTCVTWGPTKNIRRVHGWFAELAAARRAREQMRAQSPLFAEEDAMSGQPLYLPRQWGDLVALRRERGISKAAVAERLGVSEQLVTYWEAGQTPAPFYVVLQYAEAIGAEFGITFGSEVEK